MVLTHLFVGILAGSLVGMVRLITVSAIWPALGSYALVGSLALLASALLSLTTPRPPRCSLNRYRPTNKQRAEPLPVFEGHACALPMGRQC